MLVFKAILDIGNSVVNMHPADWCKIVAKYEEEERIRKGLIGVLF